MKTFDRLIDYFNRVLGGAYFSLLRITALHMDSYTISRVFIQKSINNTKEVIFYCGDAHIDIYLEFFKNYLKSDVIFSLSGDTTKCLNISTSLNIINPYIYREKYIQMQNDLQIMNNIINKYKRVEEYNNTREALGNLLDKAININESYTIYQHLVNIGAPITYQNVLADALLKFGFRSINIISTERLTYYMNNNKSKLIEAIIEYYETDGTDIEKIIIYLIQNDKMYKSHPYHVLQDYFKSHPKIYKLLKN